MFWNSQDLVNAPYKIGEFKGRNWGHSWHSLCSYHGKLKPSIAHALVRDFSSPGDIVLDPLAGVGTIPLEARLLGRKAIGNDLSPFAAAVNRAKLHTPSLPEMADRLSLLESTVDRSRLGGTALESFNDFGFNGKISDYFHPDTLEEIIILRGALNEEFRQSSEGSLIFSALAHVLHGNRPYALSRRSHPLTPYAPTGPFEYKNAIDHVKAKLTRALNEDGQKLFYESDGLSYERDYKQLRQESWYGKVDLIATSPPFVGSLKFSTHNWLRLWLAGWEYCDFRSSGSELEQPGITVEDAYREFVSFSYGAVRPGGLIVMHTGRNSKCDMGAMIERIGSEFGKVHLANESVVGNERHGLRDKGGTTVHQFAFLRKAA